MTTGGREHILALIPARGGSKGIPRKNVLVVDGKPLLAHTIEQALASRYITRTIVSTDDAEIAAVARHYGAEVPFERPSEYAKDLSPDVDVFRHALTWLREREKFQCSLVVHLRPSAPVRHVSVIDEAIELMLRRPDADSLRSVSAPRQTPYKMWRVQDGWLRPMLILDGVRESYCLPRQRLPAVWWQNGYIDIVRPNVVLESGLMCGHAILPFVIEGDMLELDDLEQVPAVEAALRGLREGSPMTAGACVVRYPA